MIGIDISNRSIKIAEIEHARSPKLKTVCWSPLREKIIDRGVIREPAEVVIAIQEAFVRCSPRAIEGVEVVASIPEAQSFMRVVEIPSMSDADVSEAIQWAMRQHIPFDLDLMYLDWQSVGTAPNGRRLVLVGAVPKKTVDPLLQVLDEAGLSVEALEFEAQAIVRSLLPEDAKDIQGIAVVDLAATSTNIIVFDRGAIRYTASIAIGGDDITSHIAKTLRMSVKDAAESKTIIGVTGRNKQEEAIAYTTGQKVNEQVNRVSAVLAEVASQLPETKGVQAMLLSGGSANLPGILGIFSKAFPGIPVQMGNPWTNLSVSDESAPLAKNDAAHFTTAIGLALRKKESL